MNPICRSACLPSPLHQSPSDARYPRRGRQRVPFDRSCADAADFDAIRVEEQSRLLGEACNEQIKR